ncbi:MAG TPA: HIT domain-containing protein [Dehalococcoidia bacterium]|nr:HIT domain-containing protein [Dehalococcoidia bacterium]
MEHLWAPWRMQYIKIAKEEGCILCQKPRENSDTANYILYRGRHNFIIMNCYPYNSGHLMIAPNRHIASLEKLTDEELYEHYKLVQRSIAVLKEEFKPEGFNVGMNLGRIAGAGVDKHIHTHIVPRWAGDTNFMPVIADTDVVNEALVETYERLAGKF